MAVKIYGSLEINEYVEAEGLCRNMTGEFCGIWRLGIGEPTSCHICYFNKRE